MRLNGLLAVVLLFLALSISAQTAGPEFSGEPFAGMTTGASLAADQKGPVFAWCAPRQDGEMRVFVGRPDGSGRLTISELTPWGDASHVTFDWPAIASDGHEAVVVARQASNAIVGWAIDRDPAPHLILWSSAPPALAGGGGRFYLASAANPADIATTGLVDEIARASSATVYVQTDNRYTTSCSIVPEITECHWIYQGVPRGVLTFTADSMNTLTASPGWWDRATPWLASYGSRQSATIGASPRDWIVLARRGADSLPAPLTALRFIGDGTSELAAMSTILIATLPPESAGTVEPPAGSRLWFARAAFDGQRYGVAWQEMSARGDHDIYFATIDADNKVSAPLLVAGSTADERRPLITATGAGSFFVGYEIAADHSIRVAGRAVLLGPMRRRVVTR